MTLQRVLGSLANRLRVKSNLSDLDDQQAALNTLTDVANATDEHVLKKDTATGDAIFKVAVEPGWTDLAIPAAAFKLPPSQVPTPITWNSLRALQFASTDHLYIEGAQLPHGYLRESDLYFHVHFTTDANITDGETVVWNLEHSVSTPFGLFPAPTTLTTTFTNDATARGKIAAAGIDVDGTTILPNVHLITESGVITGTGFDLSTVVMGELIYDSGTTSTFGGDPIFLSADFHYQLERYGSVNEFTG